MDELSEKPANNSDSLDTLEDAATVVEPAASDVAPAPDSANAAPGSAPSTGSQPPKKPKRKGPLPRWFGGANIYILSLALIIVVALVAMTIAYLHSREAASNHNIKSQDLSQSTLNQLANSDVTVGDAKQTLNVQSNAVFAGQVLIRSNLEVAGKLQIGNSLSLPGIAVSGTSLLDEVQVNKDLAVAGDTALQGQLTVQKSLNVTGNGTFGSLSATQLTVNTLLLNGDLKLTHHISAGGVNPGRSNGGALGSGGTSSVSGSDTAGSITINTGGGPSAGCLVTVNFSSRFNSTPHVVITPVGSAAAGLNYYINRSTSNFSVCTTNAPPAGASFGFDYVAID